MVEVLKASSLALRSLQSRQGGERTREITKEEAAMEVECHGRVQEGFQGDR